jgi:hypothetical protein
MNLVQCRMARGALDWSTRQVAAAAGVPIDAVRRFQIDHMISVEYHKRVRSAFEKAGVIFVEDNGEGAGVRLRKGPQAATVAQSIKINFAAPDGTKTSDMTFEVDANLAAKKR